MGKVKCGVWEDRAEEKAKQFLILEGSLMVDDAQTVIDDCKRLGAIQAHKVLRHLIKCKEDKDIINKQLKELEAERLSEARVLYPDYDAIAKTEKRKRGGRFSERKT